MVSRKRYRAIKEHSEVKYNKPEERIDHYHPGTTTGGWYQWRTFAPDIQYVGGATSSATGEVEAIGVPLMGAYGTLASFNSYNLCTRIAEGTSAFERVGRSINVLKDKYTFEWRIRRDDGEYWKDPVTAPTNIATGVSNRPFRVRMVGIYIDRVQEPGAPYLGTNEVFEERRSIHSNFRAEYKHFTVVYDKTFLVTSTPPDVQTAATYTGDGPTLDSGMPVVVTCKFSSKPYIKSWDAENTNGYDTSGYSTGTTYAYKITRIGATRGVIQWFYYLEDLTPPIQEDPASTYTYKHPSLGLHVVVKRVIKYTDS